MVLWFKHPAGIQEIDSHLHHNLPVWPWTSHRGLSSAKHLSMWVVPLTLWVNSHVKCFAGSGPICQMGIIILCVVYLASTLFRAWTVLLCVCTVSSTMGLCSWLRPARSPVMQNVSSNKCPITCSVSGVNIYLLIAFPLSLYGQHIRGNLFSLLPPISKLFWSSEGYSSQQLAKD